MHTQADESLRQASSSSSSSNVDEAAHGVQQQQQQQQSSTAMREAAAARHGSFHTLLLCPLQNLGNTCYFNAGLQILANCPAFVYGLQHSPFLSRSSNSSNKRSTSSSSSSGHALSVALARLLYDMEDYRPASVTAGLAPVTALNALRVVHSAFDGWSQQDCMEMLSAVIGAMEDDGYVKVDVATLLASFARDGGDGVSSNNSSSSSAVVACHNANKDVTATAAHVCNGHSHSTTTTTAAAASSCSSLSSTASPHSKATAQQQHNGHRSDNNGRADQVQRDAVGSRVGARSAHTFAALRLMRSVDEDNAALQACVAARKRAAAAASSSPASPPSSSVFWPPQLHYNMATDAFKGYTVSHIRCHHCQRISRVVEPFSALMLDLPTHKQRVDYARRHPHVRRLGPDGQPLPHKPRSDVTWWNPLSYVVALCHRLCDLAHTLTGMCSYPLTLQECLDIHFDAVALRGNNRYRCESCGCVSEATKSTTLLALPEYLLLHMKRFRAGHLFHTKKTDSVLFPVAWSPLSRRSDGAGDAAATSAACAVAEVLDLGGYADACVAPYLAHTPAHAQQRSMAGNKDTAVATVAACDEHEMCDLRQGEPTASATRTSTAHDNNNSNNSGTTTAADVEAVVALDALAARLAAANTLRDGSRANTSAAREGNEDEDNYSNCSRNNNNNECDSSNSSGSHSHDTPRHLVSTYTLEGVVNHHGVSIGGGHYTAFVHKRTGSDDDDDNSNSADGQHSSGDTTTAPAQGVWVYMSDNQLVRASASDVADSEEYVLLYRKQRLVEPDEEARRLRNKARYCLLTAAEEERRRRRQRTSTGPGNNNNEDDNKDDDEDKVYISRVWLQRMAYYTDPGPILNELCYCRAAATAAPAHGDSSRSAGTTHMHVHADTPDVAAYYVRIPRSDYDAFFAAYGGNAALTHAAYKQLQQQQQQRQT